MRLKTNTKIEKKNIWRIMNEKLKNFWSDTISDSWVAKE